MATSKREINMDEIAELFLNNGILPHELDIAMKAYNILDNALVNNKRLNVCLLSNCRANHLKREEIATKSLERNIIEVLNNGNKLRPKDKKKTTNNQADGNVIYKDTQTISDLVLFELASREEILDADGKSAGVYYVINENGKKFVKGEYKIPLKITILDGEVYDKATRYSVGCDFLRDEKKTRARLKNSSVDGHYTFLNDRPLRIDGIDFYSIEEYEEYLSRFDDNKHIYGD